MLNKLKIAALAGCAALSFAGVSPANAVINAPVPVDNYITVGGLDWAWAAPCAAYGDSCGVVDMSDQSTQGWRFPTLSEFLARPATADFGGKCAAAWFSTAHNHCDFSDPDSGYLFDYGYGITSGGATRYAETWVVRGLSAPAVPEPASWAMMIAGMGLIGTLLRRSATRVSFA